MQAAQQGGRRTPEEGSEFVAQLVRVLGQGGDRQATHSYEPKPRCNIVDVDVYACWAVVQVLNSM
jgi:hypothetical protein